MTTHVICTMPGCQTTAGCICERTAPPRIKLGMVTLYDAGGARHEFDPQPDITAYELAMITNMAFKLTMNREVGIPDWRGYLEEHKLSRHFKSIT